MGITEGSKNLLLGVGASPIMYLLIGASVLAVAVTLERLWAFHSLRDDVFALSRDLEQQLAAGDLAGATLRAERSPSVEGAVALSGLRQAHFGRDAIAGVMAGRIALERNQLERRLGYLGTLGNNGPFIGLLGTVIGIISAFENLSKSSAQDTMASNAVMASISEALVATAAGLLVAIPCVLTFNYFQRRIKSTLSRAEAMAALVAALAPQALRGA